ncbi:MAG: helix-turn-helix transcriptional regulator [Nevskiaceae bacterium]|jgi:transcriptional regulator with XRE-family HTH domain|nr:helix-turn-helix transcriptional regulator [Nevskiaceae bacterium]
MQQSPSANPLGQYLRARREQSRPADFGLSPGPRRRTPGLRREEAAQLCGISLTWLTWLEQGRSNAVSAPTLAAIARGLKLSRAERQYLFQLAARSDPTPQTQAATTPVQLQSLVNAVRSCAYVIDRHWDAVVWNRAAASLFSPWLGGAERNLLRFVFLDRSAKRFIVNWSERARRLVAEFRADTAGWQDDPVRKALVAELIEGSADFAAAWQSQAVRGRDGGKRSFMHPRRGRCEYEQYTLRLAQQPDLKLIVLAE